MGSNGAQRCAKYLSSACSLAPLLLGGLREAFGFSLMAMALAGGLLQGLCTLAVALAALEPQRHLGVCLLASYAMAYGAVVSSMPLLTRSAAPSSFRSGLMQAFVALLSAGGLLGIAAAALARSYRADHWALSCAVLVLLLGLGCLAGGVPLRCARRLVACALRLEPEHLEPAGRESQAISVPTWGKDLGFGLLGAFTGLFCWHYAFQELGGAGS